MSAQNPILGSQRSFSNNESEQQNRTHESKNEFETRNRTHEPKHDEEEEEEGGGHSDNIHVINTLSISVLLFGFFKDFLRLS